MHQYIFCFWDIWYGCILYKPTLPQFNYLGKHIFFIRILFLYALHKNKIISLFINHVLINYLWDELVHKRRQQHMSVF